MKVYDGYFLASLGHYWGFFYRCFYVAESFASLRKWTESAALYDRALEYVKQAKTNMKILGTSTYVSAFLLFWSALNWEFIFCYSCPFPWKLWKVCRSKSIRASMRHLLAALVTLMNLQWHLVMLQQRYSYINWIFVMKNSQINGL